MKSIIIALFFYALTVSHFSFGAETAVEQKYIFANPILPPDKVVELSEKYITSEKHININNYYLSSVSFGFYHSSDSNKDIQGEAKWFVSYECKPTNNAVAIGCDFSLSVSNSESPKIVFYPGR